MKTADTKPQAAPHPAGKARFLEIRAGRLRSEESRSSYSPRLAQNRRFGTEPTD